MSHNLGKGRASLLGITTMNNNDEYLVPMGRGRRLTRDMKVNSSDENRKPFENESNMRTKKVSNKEDLQSSSSGIASGISISKPSGGKGRAAIFGRSVASSSGIVSDFPSPSVTCSLTDHSSESSSLVKRSGKSGKHLSVRSNYIRLEFIENNNNNNNSVHEYEVSFDPQVEDPKLKKKIINEHWHTVGGKAKVFDDGQRIWTREKLTEDVSTGKYTLRNGRKTILKMKFKRTKPFRDCDKILNIIFKQIKHKLNMVKYGRKNFYPDQKHSITDYRLEVWPGFITAVEEYDGGILINIDVTHKVLRSETVLELMMEIRKNSNANTFKKEISNQLVGSSVMTSYNKKVYRIDDVDFDQNPSCMFSRKMEQISYLDYYREQYGIEIKDCRQPLLVHRQKRKPLSHENEDMLLLLIPELCHPTGITEPQRNNFKLMKNVFDFTRQKPGQRDESIDKFIQSIITNERANSILKEWGLRLPSHSIDLPARVMESERIYFGNNKHVLEHDADWGRACSFQEMLNPVTLENWAIICTSRDSRLASTFFEMLIEISRKIKLKIERPETVFTKNDSANCYCECIRRLKKDIVVIIFPSQRDDRYASVKKLCNSELGLPSQVVNSKTIQNPKSLRSVVTKILLQMNCKLGGALWSVMLPFKEEGVMYCGIDVYHEATHRSQSVVALVCSLDKNTTRWTSYTAIHNRGQEITDVCSNLFSKCAEQWVKINGTLPRRIIVYRDGVGDSQLKTVRDHEVPQFIRTFSSLSDDPVGKKNYNPYLTYIIVQKRINTRYYTQSGTDFINPLPGTVVDHTITRRDLYDYFLVSQKVRQGTVSPTHYIVIYDNSEMSPDTMQKISYKMTHLYYNWSGTVRVPAPCQYAHKLAYLVGQYTHAPAHESLRNTLHYL